MTMTSLAPLGGGLIAGRIGWWVGGLVGRSGCVLEAYETGHGGPVVATRNWSPHTRVQQEARREGR